MDKKTTINRARILRQEDELDLSRDLLLELLIEYPEDPLVQFELGGAYDVLGDTAEAIKNYELAIDNGLEEPELEECYICLGTCYRVIGASVQAVSVLEETVTRYPESISAKTFLAIAYYSDKRFHDAVKLLLELILENIDDEEITAYYDTLEFFKDNLDEIWVD